MGLARWLVLSVRWPAGGWRSLHPGAPNRRTTRPRLAPAQAGRRPPVTRACGSGACSPRASWRFAIGRFAPVGEPALAAAAAAPGPKTSATTRSDAKRAADTTSDGCCREARIIMAAVRCSAAVRPHACAARPACTRNGKHGLHPDRKTRGRSKHHPKQMVHGEPQRTKLCSRCADRSRKRGERICTLPLHRPPPILQAFRHAPALSGQQQWARWPALAGIYATVKLSNTPRHSFLAPLNHLLSPACTLRMYRLPLLTVALMSWWRPPSLPSPVRTWRIVRALTC